MYSKRKQIRLRHFDYGNTGAYYITICTDRRKRFLSTINGPEVTLTKFGTIAQEELERISQLRENVSLGEYVIMPNHIHFILYFFKRAGEALEEKNNSPIRIFGGSHGGSLSSILRGFKSSVTSRIRKEFDKPKAMIWQRGFYEHIIRDEKDIIRITDYIMTNPLNWHLDHENPESVGAH